MRILHINKFYHPWIGGVERAVQNMVEELSALCYVEVLVCNPSFKSEVQSINGVKVTKVGSFGRLWSMPMSLLFPLYLYKRGKFFDILHFHLPFPLAVLSFLLLRWFGLLRTQKLIVTWHSNIVRQRRWAKFFYFHFLKKFLNIVDCIITTSNALCSSSMLSLYREKCKVLPLFLNLKKLRKMEDKKPPRVPNWKNFALFVGRLVPYKGVEYLIEAASYMKLPLIIVGDGHLMEKFKRIVHQLGIEERVYFAGKVNEKELLWLYKHCTLLVLPSVQESEAFGLVQIEAMAFARPIINTRLPTGVVEVAEHGKEAVTVEPGNSKALADAVNFLTLNAGVWKRLSENARKKAEKFCCHRIIPSNLKIYKEHAPLCN